MRSIAWLLLMVGCWRGACAQRVELTRDNATVVLEGYAPGIVRVTLSLEKPYALKGPGVGIVAEPAASGWAHASSDAGDEYRSAEMVVKVGAYHHWTPTGTNADIAKYFNGSTPGFGLEIQRADGRQVLRMNGWEMSVPNHKDGDSQILYDRRPGDDPFYRVGATFAAPSDEHYYGLGQNQQGELDLRGQVCRVRA